MLTFRAKEVGSPDDVARPVVGRRRRRHHAQSPLAICNPPAQNRQIRHGLRVMPAPSKMSEGRFTMLIKITVAPCTMQKYRHHAGELEDAQQTTMYQKDVHHEHRHFPRQKKP